MKTITAVKLKKLLNMVPDNTPVYIVGENDEDGIICDVSLHSDEEKEFNRFEIRIDYIFD